MGYDDSVIGGGATVLGFGKQLMGSVTEHGESMLGHGFFSLHSGIRGVEIVIKPRL